MDIWSSLQIIKKHRWLILAVSALSYLMVIFCAHFITDDYVSTAKLIVTPQARVAPVTAGANGQGTDSADWLLDTKVLSELFVGQEFMERVVKIAKLGTSWTDLRSRLRVTPVVDQTESNSTILEVSAFAPDPHQCYVIADTVSTEFTHYVPEIASREYASNRRFLSGLVEEAQQKLSQAEANVKTWQEQHQALDVTAAATDYVKSMNELEKEKLEAEQRAESLQVRITDLRNYLDDKGDSAPPWLVLDQKSTDNQELQQELATEKLKLIELKTTYRPGEPTLVDQQQKVDSLQQMYQSQMKTSVQSLLVDREADLKEAEDKFQGASRQLADMRRTWSLAQNNLDYNHLNREIATWSKNYDDLLAQLYQARIAEQNARREGAITILERPIPGVPLQGGLVKIKAQLPLFLPLCMALGLGVAFVIESLSKELDLRPRIEEAMELPVLGTVGRLPKQLLQQWQEI